MTSISEAFGGPSSVNPNEDQRLTPSDVEQGRRLLGILKTLDKAKPGSLDEKQLAELNPYANMSPASVDALIAQVKEDYPATGKRAYEILAKFNIQPPPAGAATLLDPRGTSGTKVTSPAMTLLGGR